MRRWTQRIYEPFCGLSHAAGAALGAVGFLLLIAMAWGRPLHLVAFTFYGLALVGLYTASTLYHSLQVNDQVRLLLRKFDHAGIYLLIAGTYGPVCLLALGQGIGTILLVFQALLAAVGITLTFTLRKVPAVLNVVLYLVMGWMAIAAMGYIHQHWPPHAVTLLVAGGIIYSIGAVIFSLDRPHLWPGKFSAHDLWHVFVLGGSACHFALMVTYVAVRG